ncbi:ATP-binding protein [Streptomyces tubercidicus]|uniref:ATP-binding protein n=1 Tax=Streptomyces tubercidicus TaxID=47759 RepID=UPI003F5C8986
MLEPPPTATWRITLPRDATAVPIARAMVRTAMQDLRMTADRTTAQLLTAELVTNVLKHTCGAGPIELVVEQRSAGCRIEVHDDDPLLVEGLGDPLPLRDPGARVVAAASAGSPSVGTPSVRTADGPAPPDGHVPTQRGEDGADGECGEPDGGDEDDGQAGADPDAYADGSLASDDTAAAGGTEAPAPAPACVDHAGRGLVLVRSLSAASGCRPTPRGKAVWFTLPELRRPRRR